MNRIFDWLEKLEKLPLNFLRITLFVSLIIFGFVSVWVTRLYIFSNVLPQIMPILWVFLWASLAQAFGLKMVRRLEWHTAFGVVLHVQGLIYQTYGIFAITSANPFSMGYSEAGRHYYASMFFSETLYGMKLPLPFRTRRDICFSRFLSSLTVCRSGSIVSGRRCYGTD